MPTVIDSLVVLLNLDPSNFTKGQKDAMASLKKTEEAATKHSKNIESGASKMGAAFTKAGFSMLGVLGIALSFGEAANRFKNFVVEVTGADAATGRAAKNMGVMTKELSAWQKLSSKFGGSSEDITGAFQNTFKIAQEIKMGGSAAQGPLGMLLGNNLSAFTQLGQGGDVTGMMKMLQGAVANASDRGQALHFLRQAGYSDTTFTMMREIGSELERNLDLQMKANVASERDVELATKRLAAWDRFGDAIERIGKLIVNSPLLNLVEKLDVITERLQHYTDKPGSILPDLANKMSDKSFEGRLIKKWFGPFGDSESQATSLLDALIQQESGGKHRDSKGNLIRNKKSGALGITQILPSTGANPGYGVKPLQNDSEAEYRRFGAEYLAAMLKLFGGDRSKALAAYNFGPGNVSKGSAYPQETLDYVSRIQSHVGKSGGSQTINIDTIEVHTQATDAKGISETLRNALQREQRMFSAHGNVGQR